MPVPIVYRKANEQNIASYSFYDLSTGTGYKNFYGATAQLVGSKVYSLLTEALGTGEFYTDSGANTQLEINFDLSINVPTTLKGLAYIMQPISINTAAGTTTVTIRLLKVDSIGTETQLGGTVSKTYSSGTTAFTNWNMVAGEIDVPVTSLKSGEKVRIEVISSASGGGSHVWLYHDPKNNTATSSGATSQVTTIMTASLPFRIDL